MGDVRSLSNISVWSLLYPLLKWAVGGTILLILLALISGAFFTALTPHSPQNGTSYVHDWGASEISQLFEKAGVEISEESINKVGLTPHDLFDGLVTAKVLQDLGVTDSLQQNRALKTIEDLDDMITHAPSGFFEWRVANLRLFDLWIAPLAMGSPRVLAIWARYFTQHYGDDHGPKESAFEQIDDVWDSVSEAEFWATWLFCPHYPLFKIAKIFQVADSNFLIGWADTFFYFFTLTGCAMVPMRILCAVRHGRLLEYLSQSLVISLGVFLSGLLLHYIGHYVKLVVCWISIIFCPPLWIICAMYGSRFWEENFVLYTTLYLLGPFILLWEAYEVCRLLRATMYVKGGNVRLVMY
jgi:hypothetical protein